MSWIELLIAYGRAVDAVTATARLWVPGLLIAAGCGLWVRRVSRRCRRGRPDTRGQGPDTPPDIAVLG